MKNVQVTMAATGQSFPSSTVAGDYLFQLTGPDSRADSVPYSGAASVLHTFTNVQPGTYTVTATLRDSTLVTLGMPITSVSFSVAADIVLQVPAGLTVQVVTV